MYGQNKKGSLRFGCPFFYGDKALKSGLISRRGHLYGSSRLAAADRSFRLDGLLCCKLHCIDRRCSVVLPVLSSRI